MGLPLPFWIVDVITSIFSYYYCYLLLTVYIIMVALSQICYRTTLQSSRLLLQPLGLCGHQVTQLIYCLHQWNCHTPFCIYLYLMCNASRFSSAENRRCYTSYINVRGIAVSVGFKRKQWQVKCRDIVYCILPADDICALPVDIT